MVLLGVQPLELRAVAVLVVLLEWLELRVQVAKAVVVAATGLVLRLVLVRQVVNPVVAAVAAVHP
jgi:hypothetical protein